MLQSAVTYGRLLARAVVAGLTSENQKFSSQLQHKPNAKPVHFVSAVAGFSKSADSAKSPLQSKWCYGEDAYFISQMKAASVLGKKIILCLGSFTVQFCVQHSLASFTIPISITIR